MVSIVANDNSDAVRFFALRCRVMSRTPVDVWRTTTNEPAPGTGASIGVAQPRDVALARAFSPRLRKSDVHTTDAAGRSAVLWQVIGVSRVSDLLAHREWTHYFEEVRRYDAPDGSPESGVPTSQTVIDAIAAS
jgi:hypothetical protein